jgi:large subunit ribosomal protein L10
MKEAKAAIAIFLASCLVHPSSFILHPLRNATMSKVIKQMQMEALRTTFQGVRDLVLLSLSKVDGVTENKLRLDLRKKKIYLHMVKNSLVRRVFSEVGIKLNTGWEGPTLMAWGGDSLADLSKTLDGILTKDAKLKDKIKPKAAVAEGQEVTFEQAKAMPTRTEAIGTILGMILSPGSQIAGQIIGPAAQIAGQIKTLSEKKPEEAPAAPPA